MRRKSLQVDGFVYAKDGSMVQYSGWQFGQPDFNPIGSDTNCVAAYVNSAYQWFDTPLWANEEIHMWGLDLIIQHVLVTFVGIFTFVCATRGPVLVQRLCIT